MKFLSTIKHEIINAIPAIIFFIIAFNLIAFTEDLMIHGQRYNSATMMTVTIGALVAGKVIILVNTFSFINAFPRKPLIYNIVWKVGIYSIAIFLFRVTEKLVHAMIHTHKIETAINHVQFVLTTKLFWAIEIWLIMILIIYVVTSEFVRIVGKDRIKQMLLG